MRPEHCKHRAGPSYSIMVFSEDADDYAVIVILLSCGTAGTDAEDSNVAFQCTVYHPIVHGPATWSPLETFLDSAPVWGNSP